ncbi:uncharacterized protein LOC129592489 isoform X2 [Paramacrobiotus metropolitanus]|uniref:uncharacterized protein LOC129592489 isoform X2 n=1 Tax=Paramacrobiotus metropolitanus TaxID=2943436 RepID=UPI0024463F8D|nr:uncharacterized protein LOC129592489 isoform X2 [Paramacrobiotus metropolitanus]
MGRSRSVRCYRGLGASETTVERMRKCRTLILKLSADPAGTNGITGRIGFIKQSNRKVAQLFFMEPNKSLDQHEDEPGTPPQPASSIPGAPGLHTSTPSRAVLGRFGGESNATISSIGSDSVSTGVSKDQTSVDRANNGTYEISSFTDFADHSRRLTAVENQMTGIQNQITEVQDRVTGLEGKMDALDAGLKEVQDEQKEIRKVQKEIQETQKEIQESQNQILAFLCAKQP